MKNTRREVFGLLIFAVFVYATGYLYQKSQEPSVVLETSSYRTVVPRQEIEIMPQVPGIIEEISVQPGENFQKGQALMKIRIVPNAVEKLQEGMEVYFITIETLEEQEFKITK